jgi:hypothetical protein
MPDTGLKKRKKPQASSRKLQAWQGLNDNIGWILDLVWWFSDRKICQTIHWSQCQQQEGLVRWDLRNQPMKGNIMDNEQLKRIADILQEILRIIKKDMGIKWLNLLT